jgi:hypothetical protein
MVLTAVLMFWAFLAAKAYLCCRLCCYFDTTVASMLAIMDGVVLSAHRSPIMHETIAAECCG